VRLDHKDLNPGTRRTIRPGRFCRPNIDFARHRIVESAQLGRRSCLPSLHLGSVNLSGLTRGMLDINKTLFSRSKLHAVESCVFQNWTDVLTFELEAIQWSMTLHGPAEVKGF